MEEVTVCGWDWKVFAEVMQSLTPLAWPMVACLVLFLYRTKFDGIFDRVSSADLFGVKFDLLTKQRELSIATSDMVDEAEGLKQALRAEPGESGNMQGMSVTTRKTVTEILQIASNSPKTALIVLSQKLDRQARLALAVRGLNWSHVPSSIEAVTKMLQEMGPINFPRSLDKVVNLFDEIRNKVIQSRATDDDALRAIDSGIRILQALADTPYERYVTTNSNIPLFNDKALQIPHNYKGLGLAQFMFNGTRQTSVVPIKKSLDYVVGTEVTYEHDMGVIVGEAWYLAADTGLVELAWGSSALFVGKSIDEFV